MRPQIRYIFVDESGDTTLTEPSTDFLSFYVIATIMVEPNNLKLCEGKAKEIVFMHAGSGELKSSSIGSNIQRRRQILKNIAESGFQYYCLVIDKDKILRESGLRYRPVFYKFLHRIFYSRIQQSYLGLNVTADRHGESRFMKSFENYIYSFSNLFNKFQFRPSKEIPLLQIADVIAGSIRRIYRGDDPSELLDILNYPSFSLEEWPPSFNRFVQPTSNTSSEKNNVLIRQIALNCAKEFIESNLSSLDKTTQLQAEAINYLLRKYFEDSHQYIFRAEIADYLSNISGENISEHVLSTQILAPARDAGVIIASTDRGVKIPYDSNDFREWINRVNSQIVPYLKRLEKARNTILIASNNQFDIVSLSLFPDLFKYIKKNV